VQFSPAFTAVLDESTGRRDRRDAVHPRTGGPAGNSLLTAYLGLLLLALFLGELVTVLDVEGMLTWHLVLGALLVPPALVKTITTGWRAASYYLGGRSTTDSSSIEPPPMPMRLLGPLVVITTLSLLGTGLALIALGPDAGRRPNLWFGLDVLTLHQAAFIAFDVVVGLHVLARFVPALRRVSGRVERAVPGRRARAAVLAVTLVAAGVTTGVVLAADGQWQRDAGQHHDHRFPGQQFRPRG
jgi:hypothetical protein